MHVLDHHHHHHITLVMVLDCLKNQTVLISILACRLIQNVVVNVQINYWAWSHNQLFFFYYKCNKYIPYSIPFRIPLLSLWQVIIGNKMKERAEEVIYQVIIGNKMLKERAEEVIYLQDHYLSISVTTFNGNILVFFG